MPIYEHVMMVGEYVMLYRKFFSRVCEPNVKDMRDYSIRTSIISTNGASRVC